MGNIIDRAFSVVSSLSFPRSRSTDDDSGSVYTYTYPSKDGQPYFSPHFFMGGKRFDSFQPESFLFGENIDLNFLGSKPTPFPYNDPIPTEPMKSLQSLVHIRKESIRFVRVTDPNLLPKDSQGKKLLDSQTSDITKTSDKDRKSKTTSPAAQQHQLHKSNKNDSKGKSSQSSTNDNLSKDPPERFYYNIEFTFDTDVSCGISIYYFCSEEVTPTGVRYHPKDWSICHEKVYFSKGAGQHYCQPAHVFCPNDYNDSDLMYRFFDDNGFFDPKIPFPLVVQVTALEGEEPKQSHSLIAAIERNSNSGSFTLKPFIQKVFIDGMCYLIQEIYGIENKISETAVMENNGSDQLPKEGNEGDTNHVVQRYISPEEEMEESSASECVVCLSDSRDTLILPCRHLCLCNACADSLRYQANNCPICRAPFRALLQIQAVRRSVINGANVIIPTLMTPASLPSSSSGNIVVGIAAHEAVNIPVGYESLPLVEALNGVFMSSSGMWSSNRSGLPPDIERTPVSVRRSHRGLRTPFGHQTNSHHGVNMNFHQHHMHNHSGQQYAPRRILSAGHGDTIILSEDIPLPSRRLTSSQSVRSASPSNIVTSSTASCHPMTSQHFPISSSSLMSSKTPPIPFSHVVTQGAELSNVVRRESPKTEEPPEPAPHDWKVQSSRIQRKGSDPDEMEESSSSTSSSVVPQETTRLLPSGDNDDNCISTEMMKLRTHNRSPNSLGRKSPNRAKSSFASTAIKSSPKNRHRDMSLSSSAQAMLSHSMSSPISSQSSSSGHFMNDTNIRVNPCSDDDDIVSSSSVSVVISKHTSDEDSLDDLDKKS
jgi:hypothetical protein